MEITFLCCLEQSRSPGRPILGLANNETGCQEGSHLPLVEILQDRSCRLPDFVKAWAELSPSSSRSSTMESECGGLLHQHGLGPSCEMSDPEVPFI